MTGRVIFTTTRTQTTGQGASYEVPENFVQINTEDKETRTKEVNISKCAAAGRDHPTCPDH